MIQQGFENFVDPLNENDLAGLSQEPDIDSRIISKMDKNWQLNHGPFDDINAHCIGAWSLLVQSVDHYIPEADALMRTFDFIPHWRMDDLMVSYSNKGAGVGPHLDQYDVFIIQGKGTRRWQVGLPAEFTHVRPHRDLSQITEFEPVIDQVLHSGDIIYIPANHPHNGVALDACLNYSVGFRAPTQQELLSSFADFALDKNLFQKRFTDEKIASRDFSGEVKIDEVSRFKNLLQQVLEKEHFSNWTAQFLSQSATHQGDDEQELEQFSIQEINQLIDDNTGFVRSLGIKPVFVEPQSTVREEFYFYIQGDEFSAPNECKQLVVDLLNQPVFNFKESIPEKNRVFFVQLLATLVNAGYWYPEH